MKMSKYDELFYSSFEYKTSQLFASFVKLGTELCFSISKKSTTIYQQTLARTHPSVISRQGSSRWGL